MVQNWSGLAFFDHRSWPVGIVKGGVGDFSFSRLDEGFVLIGIGLGAYPFSLWYN